MKLKDIIRLPLKLTGAMLAIGMICGVIICSCSGCASVEAKIEPIPVPTVDYKSEICGMWEGINSQNISHNVRFDYKPNLKVYIYVKQGEEYIEVPADGTYDIYDNKILHMMWSIKKNATETTYSEEFWHVTITGKVMYLSAKKLSKDGESYVVTLTMKKVNNVANK